MEKKKDVQKDADRPKCSKCNSGFIYIRLKDHSLVCRSCGNVENMLGRNDDGSNKS